MTQNWVVHFNNTIISTGSIMEQAVHATENRKTSGQYLVTLLYTNYHHTRPIQGSQLGTYHTYQQYNVAVVMYSRICSRSQYTTKCNTMLLVENHSKSCFLHLFSMLPNFITQSFSSSSVTVSSKVNCRKTSLLETCRSGECERKHLVCVREGRM